MTFDITIPVLNEEERLERGVTQTVRFLDRIGEEHYTLTIADNGSVDDTEHVAGGLIDKYPKVRLVKTGKKGVGLALKHAWGSSVCDVVGYMDVDLATDVRHLSDVMEAFRGQSADVVNGSRYLPGSVVANRSMVRTVSSVGFNFILKKALGTHFTDGMCGFKFIRKDLFEELSGKGLETDGWFFCAEMLVLAEWSGKSIIEIPVNWHDDGDSRVRFTKLIPYYLGEIGKLRRKVRQERARK